MTVSIAIVGMACMYPDARSPRELWENVLAQRRAFRRLPDARLRLADYTSPDPMATDSLYSGNAAVIEGYEFDRRRFRVAGSTFRSADLAHWLALDVASQTLDDAGFNEAQGLPRETMGVFVGNTLTGEFSRANALRLRWPYVRRTIAANLVNEKWPIQRCHDFLGRVEATYKEPFPPITEETLAGGLSNTIAGRICNHFDFKGGGYSLDGACASSLLAVANACSALSAGDVDAALAGGVDLSLDPFELVGFSRIGALATHEMRVYDSRSNGFWPGEGCGFVLLMRHHEAVALKRRIYASIQGWGISSDGKGGITRPEVEGQLLALDRAYRRAGFGIETVAYFEGHGTGTSVGDATELQALSHARRQTAGEVWPAAIGSIKANIGHTKAAAGVAGLIKATMAVSNQILPPTTGCEEPHPEFQSVGEKAVLRVLKEGELWPENLPLRAGVSAMGFGGINTHVALEEESSKRRHALKRREQTLLRSSQDAELLLMGSQETNDLLREVEHLLSFSAKLSRSEIADLSTQMARTLNHCRVRAAVVASTPSELTGRLETLRSWLTHGKLKHLDISAGVFLGSDDEVPRVGFLFPGQGSPANLGGGALRCRFDFVEELYSQARLPAASDGVTTAVAQPAIVTASLAGLRVLDKFGITARVAVGHSLGEMTALHWAGALDEEALLRLAYLRGKTMAETGAPSGAMASIGTSLQEVTSLLDGDPLVIAGLNAPHQTVISGEARAVKAFVTRAQSKGIQAVMLPVSHAFHSPLVAAAAPVLAKQLALEKFQPLNGRVVSTVTGALLSPEEDLKELLCHQVTSPVRFMEAIERAADGLDLLIEVGPGNVLTGLVSEFRNLPAVAMDAGGSSLHGLWQAVAAAFVLGVPVAYNLLFKNRFTRPFNRKWCPRFFMNPCELAPTSADAGYMREGPTGDGEEIEIKSEQDDSQREAQPHAEIASPLEIVRHLVAHRTELPVCAVQNDDRLLGDLHMNSITVSQLVIDAARRLALPPPVAPMDYSHATVADVGQALEELKRTGNLRAVSDEQVSGVDCWVRTFTVELVERPLPNRQARTVLGKWRLIAPPDYLLTDPLQQAFARETGEGGTVVCLPPAPDERHVGLLLAGAHEVLRENKAGRFVFVQHGGGAAAFARTLYLEAPGITTCVVDVPVGHPAASKWVLAEATRAAAARYSEAHYDEAGTRRERVLRLLALDEEPGEIALGIDDLLLVTGGGKGIAAECALALARETGVRLALLGRSHPDDDSELALNLERMAAAGIRCKYLVADVTDEAEVRAAVSEVQGDWGPVTAVLHGAGRNVPQLLNSLKENDFLQTLAPKLQGIRNILSAIDADKLRLLVTFSSLIARTGMRGEADYAVANEWLTRMTEGWQVGHPHCRCLAVEWSVWSGVGMGERLGRLDALMQQGITPIPLDNGIRLFLRLLGQRSRSVSVVVTGRYGEAPTLKREHLELPFLRFLEQPRVYYPGVELVVDAELSVVTDPYTDDHLFQGERLFPAVMGLEAMAQAAVALASTDELSVFEAVKFIRPVTIPDDGPVTIRLAALMRKPDLVEVVLRSKETAFMVDHFRAVCRFGDRNTEHPERNVASTHAESEAAKIPPVRIDPEEDLYGGVLFQKGRFQRIRAYRQLRATECLAEITTDETIAWFNRYLPSTLVLGDPGARDACIHAVQACIPHQTLIPIGVDRLVVNPAQPRSDHVLVRAQERSHEDDTFIYDLSITEPDGTLRERWEGLRLQIVSESAVRGAWVEPLLGPYLERRICELLPDSAGVSVVVERDASVGPRERSDRVVQRALGTTAHIRRRPDGKAEVTGTGAISSAHAGDLTLGVAGKRPLGCDLEPVITRPASTWRELLGPERHALAEVLVRGAGEDETTACTRVWAAGECLRKAGAMVNAPLIFTSATQDGWVLLTSGLSVAATYAAQVQGAAQRMVLAVLCGSNHASL